MVADDPASLPQPPNVTEESVPKHLRIIKLCSAIFLLSIPSYGYFLFQYKMGCNSETPLECDAVDLECPYPKDKDRWIKIKRAVPLVDFGFVDAWTDDEPPKETHETQFVPLVPAETPGIAEATNQQISSKLLNKNCKLILITDWLKHGPVKRDEDTFVGIVSNRVDEAKMISNHMPWARQDIVYITEQKTPPVLRSRALIGVIASVIVALAALIVGLRLDPESSKNPLLYLYFCLFLFFAFALVSFCIVAEATSMK